MMPHFGLHCKLENKDQFIPMSLDLPALDLHPGRKVLVIWCQAVAQQDRPTPLEFSAVTLLKSLFQCLQSKMSPLTCSHLSGL